MSQPLLEVQNLVKYFPIRSGLLRRVTGHVRAVDNVSFVIQKGETVVAETRGFNGLNGSTFSMRKKDTVNDYRYFPEPDLPPVYVTEDYIANVKAHMPKLPNELKREYMEVYGLPEYDARIITEEKELAEYFNLLLAETKNYKAASNWILGPLKNYFNEHGVHISNFKVPPVNLAKLIALIDEGKTNFSIASTKIFPVLVETGKEPLKIAEELNLLQSSDEGMIKDLVEQVIAKYPEKVAEYRTGKKGLLGLFVGEVMKLSRGKADPKLTNKLVTEKLES